MREPENSTPLVSVVMIFLNAETFIEEAIACIFAQTYDNWELLLVDDGSVDRSTDYGLGYAKNHPDRVRYLEHKGHQNRGMSASRNLGIQNAHGDYIAFLDADDIWLPQRLEHQVAILSSQSDAAMVYGPTQWWYSWTGNQEDQKRDYVHKLGLKPNRLIQPPELLEHIIQDETLSPCTCSVLVRSEAFEKVGGFEESFTGLYEDQAFFVKLSSQLPVYVTDTCLAYYRQHPDSNCSIMQKTGQAEVAQQAFVDWLSDYFSKQGMKNPRIWSALRKKQSYRQGYRHRLMDFASRSVLGQVYRGVRQWRLKWTSLPLIRNLRCIGFRRLKPIANGHQRGTPIVRYYWANFLQKHESDIQGRALEIGSTSTIRQYGGQNLIEAHAIDLKAHSSEVTLTADLSRADHIPSDRFDCFVNQFTLHLIYDVEAALYHSIRILKPRGSLLVNFPSVDYYFPTGLDMGTGKPLFMYWWFTPIQVENFLRRLELTESDYRIQVYGNLFSRVAYQVNMPAEELTRSELEFVDLGHPLLICARIVKPENWQAVKPHYRTAWTPDTLPARWNPKTGHYAQ